MLECVQPWPTGWTAGTDLRVLEGTTLVLQAEVCMAARRERGLAPGEMGVWRGALGVTVCASVGGRGSWG